MATKSRERINEAADKHWGTDTRRCAASNGAVWDVLATLEVAKEIARHVFKGQARPEHAVKIAELLLKLTPQKETELE